MNIQDKKYKKIYFVGIKGGGMTALSLLLKGLGKIIEGSDTNEIFYTDKVLKDNKIFYYENFKETNISADIDLLIYSTAYDPTTHIEIVKATNIGIEVVSYPEALGSFIALKKTIAIAGTHGKTTTTALLSFILKYAGVNPNALIGSNVPQLGGTTLVGKSDLFIVETDEYQNKFRFYDPYAIILTNMEWDHPDFYTSPESYIKAFFDYLKKIPTNGFLVAGIDSPDIFKLISKLDTEIITFGQNNQSDWQVKKINIKGEITDFEIWYKQSIWSKAKIFLKGDFNINNCLAAVATAVRLGINKTIILEALAQFRGATRRFEFKGKYNNALIFDDFAHHPGEIKATLKMVKTYYPEKKSIVLFHPHTYTRTEKLLTEFTQSFIDCNEVIVLDIYASAREKKGDINSEKLVNGINSHSHNAIFLSNKELAYDYLKNRLNKNSILITMGAGDVWRVGEKLIQSNG